MSLHALCIAKLSLFFRLQIVPATDTVVHVEDLPCFNKLMCRHTEKRLVGPVSVYCDCAKLQAG